METKALDFMLKDWVQAGDTPYVEHPACAHEDVLAAARSELKALRAAAEERDAFQESWRRTLKVVDDLRADRDALRSSHEAVKARAEELRTKASAFVNKLDELTPAINGMFTFAFVHGNKYDGPTWEKELAELRSALTSGQAQHEEKNT